MTSMSGNAPVRMVMRAPCARCGCHDGNLATVGGQDTVRCAECNQFCYNAPRSETGRETRSLRTRPDIRPRQRARILMRDGICILCRRSDVDLEAGHMISVDEGRKLGMSDADLNSDDNLAAMCKACNSGLGSRSLPPWWMAAAFWARRLNDEDRRPA